MAFCPQCGAQNPDDAVFFFFFCVKMPEVATTTMQGPPPSPQAPPPTMTTGVTAGYPQPGMAPPTTPGYPAPVYTVSRKEPALAAILSFVITGLGQIYAGKAGKGVALLIATIVSFFLSFLIIPFFIAIGLWIYGIIDAYNTAQKYNEFVTRYGRAPTPQDQW